MGLRFLVLLLLAAMGATSCEDTTATTPTTTTAIVTEPPFSGTLSINGGTTFQFSSTARGSVTATVTSLTPDTAVIGVSIGTWNGLICQLVLVDDQATQGTMFSGTVSAVGNLCLRVYDSGKLTEPASYSVTVSHP